MYERLWGQGTRDGGEEDCCCLGRRLFLRELQAELAYDPSSEAALARELRACMDASPRQAAAFDAITNAIDAGESKLFFVDGLGGTGKSFLFTSMHYVRGRGEIAVACPWNGLAASLLPGGQHLRLPSCPGPSDLCDPDATTIYISM